MRYLLWIWLLILPARAQDTVRVLTLNVRLDCSMGVDRMAALIRKSGADIVGLQESEIATEQLARRLGMRWFQENSSAAILTRYRIVESSPRRLGVVLDLGRGRRLAAYNAHFFHQPYQPYQLLGIPYGPHPMIHTEREAIEQARLARGLEVEELLADVAALDHRGFPTVITGDFNEPSHQDWTPRATAAGLHPLPVAWPTSRAFADAGFSDAFRAVFPDEVKHPGFTWTPLRREDDLNERHDRIDYVLFRGRLKVKSVAIVAENKTRGQVVVRPYPSDHRGVVARFELI